MTAAKTLAKIELKMQQNKAHKTNKVNKKGLWKHFKCSWCTVTTTTTTTTAPATVATTTTKAIATTTATIYGNGVQWNWNLTQTQMQSKLRATGSGLTKQNGYGNANRLPLCAVELSWLLSQVLKVKFRRQRYSSFAPWGCLIASWEFCLLIENAKSRRVHENGVNLSKTHTEYL